MKRKVCVEFDQFVYPIRLYQQGEERYSVEYGAQLKIDMSYSEAARELGLCIMHALSCEGKLGWGQTDYFSL